MLLGLDVGTTGAKSVLFDTGGNVISSAFREYGVETGPGGKAEQNAETVLQAAVETLIEAVGKSGIKELSAMGISVQGDAVIPVDPAGKALGPALLGMDYRSEPQARKAAAEMGERNLFNRTGMRPHPMNSLVKMMYLKDTDPEIYQKAHKVVTYAEYITAGLGGGLIIDYTMASRTMGFDLAAREWADDIIDRCGLDREKLADAVPSGSITGELSAVIAERAGLRKGTLLVAGGHDQTCGALGAGVTEPGTGIVSTGTAEVFSTAFREMHLNDAMFDGYYPCYIHTVPDLYFTFSLNHVGGLLLRWFKEKLCRQESIEAEKAGVDPYTYLISRMSGEPKELFILPHFNGTGTPWCDLKARGGIVGMDLTTGIPELTRALLESQSYELALNLEALGKAGIQVRHLTAAGGGARSPEWLQIKADILDRPVRTLACREAAALGAAILAGTAAGFWESAREGAGKCVSWSTEYLPRPEFRTRYAGLLEQYRRIYPAFTTLHGEV